MCGLGVVAASHLQHHSLLSFPPDTEGQKEAENCHADWEATSEETRPANPSGIGEGSLEELKASAGEEDSESDEDDSLEEDGESPCEGEAKENRKVADKAKVTWAQHFKGTIVRLC